MKTYYVKHPRNFANEYDLCWIESTDTKNIEDAIKFGWNRITRKEAFEMISAEKRRRASDYEFSGYAPIEILPYADFLAGQFCRLERNMGVFVSYDLETKKRLYSDDGVIFE